MHLFPLGRKSMHILCLCECTHTYKHTQMHAGGGLACKADSFTLLMDLCLAGVSFSEDEALKVILPQGQALG